MVDNIAAAFGGPGGVFATPDVLAIVSSLATGLPVDAAHIVWDGKVSYQVYWVSGTKLVTLDIAGSGANATHGAKASASGNVRDLALATLTVDADATFDSFSRTWDVARTVKLSFDADDDSDEYETLTFPDPANLPLDNQDKRDKVNAFLDAVLTAAG